MDGLICVEEFVKFVAPAAPVSAELEKNDFVFFFGLFHGGGELLLAVRRFVVDGRPGCFRSLSPKRRRQRE